MRSRLPRLPLAFAAILALIAGTRAGNAGDSPGVAHIAANAVSAAFAKGSPLLEVAAYKIHASRRDAPGMAEIHEQDTDIIYVLGGEAQLVTGGSIVDGQTVAPGEIRGKAIRQGQSYRLAAGDVMVVPNGIPHWFEQVSPPFTYYVVKVTSLGAPE